MTFPLRSNKIEVEEMERNVGARDKTCDGRCALHVKHSNTFMSRSNKLPQRKEVTHVHGQG